MNNTQSRHNLIYMPALALLLLLALGLAGCVKATPTAIPTLAVTPPSGSEAGSAKAGAAPSGAVTASAEVAPARVAELGFASAGFVQGMEIKEGDTVKAGQRLAALANFAELEAVVTANQQSLESAQKALDTLTAGMPLALASAQQAVVVNQKRYDDAVKSHLRKDYARCSKDTIDLYSQRFEDAKDRLKRVKDGSDGSTHSLELIREAQGSFNVAQSNFLYCLSYTDQEIAESDAELAVATATLKQSQERYTLLQKENGLDPDEAARLKAAVAAAQASLISAKSALERAVVLAPFDGTIIQVNASDGQAVTPGQPVFVLANLTPLQIETTDLSERDINRVKLGQSALVSIAALGQDFPGKVLKIDPRASKIGGDVVYKVTIGLDQQPEGLRWGMSARVVIGP